MRTASLSAVIILIAANCPNVVAQQAAPLESIPKAAVAVLRIASVESTGNDAEIFVDEVQPGFGAVAKVQLPILLGNLISNPTLNGVDRSRDWYVAVFAGDDRDLILFLPTTDAAAAAASLREDTKSIEHGDWLICGRNEAVLSQIRACIDGEPSIAEGINEIDGAALLQSHIGVYVDGDSFRNAFADELASAEDKLDEVIEQMITVASSQNPQLQLDYVRDFYGRAGRILIQSVRDSESVLVTANLKSTGLQFDKTVRIIEGSPTSQFCNSQTPGSLSRLKQLPEGMDAYFAFHGDFKFMIEQSMAMMSSLTSDKEALAKIEKAIDAMSEAQFGTIAGGFALTDDEQGALRFVNVAEMSPVSVVREAFSHYESGLEFDVAGIHQKITYEPTAEKIGDTSIDLFRTEQQFSEAADPLGMQKKLALKLHGPEGLVQRIATGDDVMYQSMGGGLEVLRALIENQSSWTDSDLNAARDLQLENANLISLVDLPNGLTKFFKLILSTETLPIPISADILDGLQIPRSYIGTSVIAGEREIKARLNVAPETFKAFVTLGMFVQSRMAPQQ